MEYPENANYLLEFFATFADQVPNHTELKDTAWSGVFKIKRAPDFIRWKIQPCLAGRPGMGKLSPWPEPTLSKYHRSSRSPKLKWFWRGNKKQFQSVSLGSLEDFFFMMWTSSNSLQSYTLQLLARRGVSLKLSCKKTSSRTASTASSETMAPGALYYTYYSWYGTCMPCSH